MCPDRQHIAMTANSPYLTRRQRPSGENHHLWNNNGTWWCHFTVHTANGQKRRVRRSLRTLLPADDLARILDPAGSSVIRRPSHAIAASWPAGSMCTVTSTVGETTIGRANSAWALLGLTAAANLT